MVEEFRRSETFRGSKVPNLNPNPNPNPSPPNSNPNPNLTACRFHLFFVLSCGSICMQGCFRCPNGGVCSAPDHCSCAEGWTGYDCRTPVCEVSDNVCDAVEHRVTWSTFPRSLLLFFSKIQVSLVFFVYQIPKLFPNLQISFILFFRPYCIVRECPGRSHDGHG